MASGSAKGGTSSAGTKETRAARRSSLLRAGSGRSTFQTSNPNAANYSPF
ncbi:hypothetical protein [Hymenobacter ruber]